MKVIVAGSRTFSDRALAFAKLDRILVNVGPGECTIVSGGARGADRIGEAYEMCIRDSDNFLQQKIVMGDNFLQNDIGGIGLFLQILVTHDKFLQGSTSNSA